MLTDFKNWTFAEYNMEAELQGRNGDVLKVYENIEIMEVNEEIN